MFIADENGGYIYVNGDLIAQHDWTGVSTPCNNNFLWKIGGNYEPSRPEWWYHGKIDDIGIWDRALTKEEIIRLYNSN